ncbi:MAG: transcriptional repressor [Bacteroidetes bacterium]|nr:transcriptional repressor [Bacteroidota bacterium]
MKSSPLPKEQLEVVRSRYLDYLRERNLRQTQERLSVFEEVYDTSDHFDADELFLKLKQHHVAVSRATVYNTLELLVDCNLVVRHQFGNKQAKYERSYSFWQHDHLICEECHHLFEFCDPRIQSIREMVADIFQFDISRHSLNMYGQCKRENCEHRTQDA